MKMITILLAASFIVVATVFGSEESEKTDVQTVTYFGVHATPIAPALTAQLGLDDDVGLVIDFVERGGPADMAGLKQYDVLLKLDDQILIGNKQFSALVKNRKAGDRVEIGYIRFGKKASLTVELGERTESGSDAIKWIGEGDFEMPGPRIYRFHGSDQVPHMDHEAWADWSKRLGKNVEMVIENVYKGARHPDFKKMPRVYLKRGDKMIQFSDDDASYDYTIENGGRMLQIRDEAGVSVFAGSVESDEDLQSIPEKYRSRARLMLKMEKRLDEKQAEL